eukprot:1303429-Rhodomonas_salina.2
MAISPRAECTASCRPAPNADHVSPRSHQDCAFGTAPHHHVSAAIKAIVMLWRTPHCAQA